MGLGVERRGWAGWGAGTGVDPWPWVGVDPWTGSSGIAGTELSH
ncbi:hypothetical protein ATKI12_5181 [Kitasatospora sp. Ki12]